MAWALLLAAGLLEIVWAVALKQSEGFTRLWPSLIGISTAWVSFGLLALALRTLPAGTAYAAWTGIGIVGVAAVGMLAGGESASAPRVAALTLVLTGILALRLLES